MAELNSLTVGGRDLNYLSESGMGELLTSGWYKIMDLRHTAGGESFLIGLNRSYSNTNSESYTIAINRTYHKGNIVVLAKQVNTQAFTKIALYESSDTTDWSMSVYIYYNKNVKNYGYWNIMGASANIKAGYDWIAETPTGTLVKELAL